MSQEDLRTRLLSIIRNEGVNQKFIAKQAKISEGYYPDSRTKKLNWI